MLPCHDGEIKLCVLKWINFVCIIGLWYTWLRNFRHLYTLTSFISKIALTLWTHRNCIYLRCYIKAISSPSHSKCAIPRLCKRKILFFLSPFPRLLKCRTVNSPPVISPYTIILLRVSAVDGNGWWTLFWLREYKISCGKAIWVAREEHRYESSNGIYVYLFICFIYLTYFRWLAYYFASNTAKGGSVYYHKTELSK